MPIFEKLAAPRRSALGLSAFARHLIVGARFLLLLVAGLIDGQREQLPRLGGGTLAKSLAIVRIHPSPFSINHGASNDFLGPPNAMPSGLDPDILQQTRSLLRRDLKLAADDPLAEEMPFFGGEIDLDSLDMLLLVTSIERQFGVRITDEGVGRQAFQSVGSLARFIQQHKEHDAPAAQPSPAPTDWLALLPHGEAFRFVSRVDEVQPGRTARGVWSLTGNEPFFAAHFPGNPIVPGVLIAEALAQISGLAGAPRAGSRGMIVQIDLRFAQPAAPPVDIELLATVAQQLGSLQKCDVVAKMGTTILAHGSITLSRGEGI